MNQLQPNIVSLEEEEEIRKILCTLYMSWNKRRTGVSPNSDSPKGGKPALGYDSRHISN